MFEKVSQSLKYDLKNIFGLQTYIYKDTNTDHFTPLVLRVRGNDIHLDLQTLAKKKKKKSGISLINL